MAKSLKNFKKQLKEHGVFYTDPKLAEKLKGFFPSDIKEIYDPTCGCGNLLSVFGDEVKKFGQELDAEEATEARTNLTNCDIRVGDTLEDDQFKDRKFKYIVGNPPFSVKWDPKGKEQDPRFKDAPTLPPPSRADYAFLLHIIDKLEDDGIAVVLNSPGVLFRGQREGKIRKWLVQDKNYIDRVEQIPSGYFEDTNIETALLVIRKDREDKSTITFVSNEKDNEQTKEIEISKLLEDGEDCNLTVRRQTYVYKPLRSSEEIMVDMRGLFLSTLRHELDLFLMLHESEFQNYLNQLQSVINEYRTKKPEISLDLPIPQTEHKESA